MGSGRVRGLARFCRQVHALLLKNLSFQRRNAKTNAAIAAFPVLLCVLLVTIQNVIDHELDRPPFQCGCACVSFDSHTGACERTECGIQHSTSTQAYSCPVLTPPRWPALVQVPDTQTRALTSVHPTQCNASESCPVAVLITGHNRRLSEGLGRGLFPAMPPSDFVEMSETMNSSVYLNELSRIVSGSSTLPAHVLFIEPGLVPNGTLYLVQPKCLLPSHNISGISDGMPLELDYVQCVQGLPLWCENSSVINLHLFKGYKGSNKRRRSNEFLAGYDFLDTTKGRFHVYIWYNSTFSRDNGHHSMTVLRVARLVNMASTAYLKLLRGENADMRLEFLKEMPKAAIKIRLDLTTLLMHCSLHGRFNSFQ